jgi:DNA topoisomerase-6 subunit B
LKSEQLEALIKAMQETKLNKPSTNCLSPIGSELLKKSLETEFDIDFAHSITRRPTVYRGNPFQIEVAIGYGGELNAEEQVNLIRFANKVPLLYQEGACAITAAVKKMNWKPYGLQQSSSSLPAGPAIIAVHMASVWVPFTSEGKEAVSAYPEILKEVKLALQECARFLQIYISRRSRADIEEKKREKFRGYAEELAKATYSLVNDESYKLSDEEIKAKAVTLKEFLLEVAETMYSAGKINVENEKEELQEVEEKETESEREDEKEIFTDNEEGE